MTNMKIRTDRRRALIGLSVGLVESGLAQGDAANAATGATLEPSGANNLRDLSQALAAMPRRRDFAARPMIADNPDVWDAAALNAVFAYKGGAETGLGQHRFDRSLAQRHAQFPEFANLGI